MRALEKPSPKARGSAVGRISSSRSTGADVILDLRCKAYHSGSLRNEHRDITRFGFTVKQAEQTTAAPGHAHRTGESLLDVTSQRGEGRLNGKRGGFEIVNQARQERSRGEFCPCRPILRRQIAAEVQLIELAINRRR
jgi:hypothetical protein